MVYARYIYIYIYYIDSRCSNSIHGVYKRTNMNHPVGHF